MRATSHQQTQGEWSNVHRRKGAPEEIAPLLFCFAQELLQSVNYNPFA